MPPTPRRSTRLEGKRGVHKRNRRHYLYCAVAGSHIALGSFSLPRGRLVDRGCVDRAIKQATGLGGLAWEFISLLDVAEEQRTRIMPRVGEALDTLPTQGFLRLDLRPTV